METISVWSNFKLLSIVNQMKKTKCFAGDFIDNQRSLSFVSKTLVYWRICEKLQIVRFYCKHR